MVNRRAQVVLVARLRYTSSNGSHRLLSEMVAVGPRFFALLLVVSVILFYLTVISYENRLSALQSRLSFVGKCLQMFNLQGLPSAAETLP